MALPEKSNSYELTAELSDQLFRNLLEHTSDAIYFKDLDSRFIALSRRQALSFGLNDPQEAVSKTDFDFFTEEHARPAYNDEQQIIRSGQPIINKEERETWPDGHVTWVSSSKLPLHDDDGNIIGTFGISRVITERKQAEEALRASEESLRAALQAMESELERAHVIQRALLPASPPAHPHLDVAVRYEPLEAIGGDYYAVTPLDGNRLAVFIGDVMGHGVSAALFMALLKFITDQLLRDHCANPKSYLESLNATLMNQMPMSFATGVYGLFECRPHAARLHLAGAGHPAPILHRAEDDGVALIDLAGNAALGLTDQFTTATATLDLQPGDRVYFYTDGITEASNDQDEMLGAERLLELVRDASRPTMAETLDAVMLGLGRWRGASPIDDDILLLGFQVR